MASCASTPWAAAALAAGLRPEAPRPSPPISALELQKSEQMLQVLMAQHGLLNQHSHIASSHLLAQVGLADAETLASRRISPHLVPIVPGLGYPLPSVAFAQAVPGSSSSSAEQQQAAATVGPSDSLNAQPEVKPSRRRKGPPKEHVPAGEGRFAQVAKKVDFYPKGTAIRVSRAKKLGDN